MIKEYDQIKVQIEENGWRRRWKSYTGNCSLCLTPSNPTKLFEKWWQITLLKSGDIIKRKLWSKEV